ncbi:hypothetical protein N007_02430 [Alicyclobacillus acidoterrestris ATCC 49025]|nr:hypothetical protein N007_02430 [Alicyclobacillus acidoterrestris ATCC 49025]
MRATWARIINVIVLRTLRQNRTDDVDSYFVYLRKLTEGRLSSRIASHRDASALGCKGAFQ